METLSYIAELLLLNDCVIIPQFGGFIANYKPASVASGSFLPPSNSLSFNSKLSFNDGLLINHISIEEDLSYLSAKRKVEALVAEMNSHLAEGEIISIEAIGTLKLDEQHCVIFTPVEQAPNINAYGLSAFSYQSLLAGKLRSTLPTKHADMQPIALKPFKRIVRHALWVAPLLLLLLLLPFRPNTSHLQESNLLKLGNEPTETVVEEEELFVAEEPLNAPMEEPSAESVMLEEARELSAEEVESVASKPYHIIVGSFQEEGNASELITQLHEQGIEASNIGRIKGLDYVSVGAFATLEEAKEANSAFTQSHHQFKDAWVYSCN